MDTLFIILLILAIIGVIIGFTKVKDKKKAFPESVNKPQELTKDTSVVEDIINQIERLIKYRESRMSKLDKVISERYGELPVMPKETLYEQDHEIVNSIKKYTIYQKEVNVYNKLLYRYRMILKKIVKAESEAELNNIVIPVFSKVTIKDVTVEEFILCTNKFENQPNIN